MCGILSAFSPARAIDPRAIDAGLAALHHRGPDHRGHWLSPDGRVALGHTRLSIIDLTSGDQPISNDAGNVHLVANGELYDFEAIRADLMRRGHRFKTRSDSEIALHLYHEHGTACLRHLRGEFAFCIWDAQNRLFFAARDRVGIKPLYYTIHNGIYYFASEIKALFAAGVPAVWDEDAYLSRAFFYRDRTLFQGIHQVPPGHFMLVTAGGHRIVRYWDFDYPLADGYGGPVDEQEAVERVHAALRDAVRTRLRADVPVGVYLSGGIDSCAVLGMAAELHGRPVETFTIAFDRAEYDEAAIAERAAQRVGARFHPIAVGQDSLADHFFAALHHSETVCLNTHGVAKYLLSRAVRDRGFKVVLTGEGSDEIFGGYSSFRRDMLLHDTQRQDPQTVERLLAQLEESNKVSSGLMLPNAPAEDAGFIGRLLGFEPAWLLPMAEGIDRLKRLYGERARRTAGDSHPIFQFLAHADLSGQVYGREPVHAAMYLLAKSVLPNYILTTLGDRMEMAHSIEGRLPLIDHQVVETVVRLPAALKIRGMVEKYLLRQATRRYLPDEVYRREKHPFLAPPSTLDPQGRLHQLVQDTLRGPLVEALPFFDAGRVRAYLDDLPKLDDGLKGPAEALLMELLSLCALQHHFHIASA